MVIIHPYDLNATIEQGKNEPKKGWSAIRGVHAWEKLIVTWDASS